MTGDLDDPYPKRRAQQARYAETTGIIWKAGLVILLALEFWAGAKSVGERCARPVVSPPRPATPSPRLAVTVTASRQRPRGLYEGVRRVGS